MGGSPALRWMSLALARRATWRISFSSIRRRAYHPLRGERHAARGGRAPETTKRPAAMCDQPLRCAQCADNRLALGELEALAGAGLAVLLALHGAGVAGDEAGLLEDRPVVRVELHERAGDAVADGAGLTGQPAALRVHEHVELAHLVDELERLDQDHLRRLPAEVGVHGAAVDGDVARAGREAHAGDGLLAAADDDGELGHRFLVTARASAPRASARRGGAHRRRRP